MSKVKRYRRVLPIKNPDPPEYRKVGYEFYGFYNHEWMLIQEVGSGIFHEHRMLEVVSNDQISTHP